MKLLVSLWGVWLFCVPAFAQDGSSLSPFTSLAQARNVTNAGNYNFLLGGTSFRTYVDLSGFVQIAYDNSNAKEALPQFTDFPGQTYGILAPSVMANLGDAQEIRISSSDLSQIDAVTPVNPGLRQRIVTFRSLKSGAQDNAVNQFWTGTGSARLIAAAGGNRNNTSLDREVFHVFNAPTGGGVHWIPIRGDRSLTYNKEIPVAQAWTLWVRGSAPTTINDSNPFTALSEAAAVTTPGRYSFNLGGVPFDTYVDANGYVQTAIDFGNGVGTLPTSTGLTRNTRGILSPAALATLTGATELRMTTSDPTKPLDAVSRNATFLTRITQNRSLFSGSEDNALNDDWTGTGSEFLRANAAQSQGLATPNTLAFEIYHVYYAPSNRGVHWYPNRGDQALAYSEEIGDAQTMTLWVRGAQAGLPLLLQSFSAYLDPAGELRIDWTIMSANGADYIDIERSGDGINWVSTDRQFVPANANLYHHGYTDKLPISGVNYYRLRQTDYDGSTDLSHILSVIYAPPADEKTVSLYPNPSRGRVYLRSATSLDASQLAIFGVTGRLITKGFRVGNYDGRSISIDIEGLLPGTYFVRAAGEVHRLVYLP